MWAALAVGLGALALQVLLARTQLGLFSCFPERRQPGRAAGARCLMFPYGHYFVGNHGPKRDQSFDLEMSTRRQQTAPNLKGVAPWNSVRCV